MTSVLPILSMKMGLLLGMNWTTGGVGEWRIGMAYHDVGLEEWGLDLELGEEGTYRVSA